MGHIHILLVGHIHIFCIIKYFPVIVYTGIEYWRIWSDVSSILVTVSRSVKGRRKIGSRCNRTFPYFTRKLTSDMTMTISACLYHVYFYRSDYCCKHLYCLFHVYIFRSGYCNKHLYVYMTISTCLYHVYISRSGYCNNIYMCTWQYPLVYIMCTYTCQAIVINIDMCTWQYPLVYIMCTYPGQVIVINFYMCTW